MAEPALVPKLFVLFGLDSVPGSEDRMGAPGASKDSTGDTFERQNKVSAV